MKYAFEKAGLTERQNALELEAAKYFNSGGTVDWFRDWADRVLNRMLGGDHAPCVQQDHQFTVPAQPPMPEGQSGFVRQDHHGAADGLPIASGEGQSPLVREDLRTNAAPARDSVSPMPGEGHQRAVREDQDVPADARQPIAGGGHLPGAHEGQSRIALPRDPIASGKAKLTMSERTSPLLPPAREPRDPSDAYRRAVAQSRLETVRTALYLHKTSTGKWYGDVCPYEFPGMRRDAKFAEAFESVFGPFNPKQERMKCGELLSAKQQEQVWELLNAA